MAPFAGLSMFNDGEPWYCFESTADDDAGMEGSGYHLLIVHDYDYTSRSTETGENITSHPFTIGGHRWCVQYYPNGKNAACADFVSLYVCLLDVEQKPPVEARFGFSIVDETGRQGPSDTRATRAFGFSGRSPAGGCERFVEKSALKLRRDCLTIRCDIVVGGTRLGEADIGQHLHSLLKSKVGADVRFEVGGETITAHRCVLAARSTVFMAQLFGPMKEGSTTSVIQIKDMEARVFKALLSFIYTDSLPRTEEVAEDSTWLQDLFVAADMYDLKRLRFLCEKQLSQHITASTVTSTLALAEQHHCDRLKEACFHFLRAQSPSCLRAVMASDGWKYISTTYPSVLNELIAELVSLNQKTDTS